MVLIVKDGKLELSNFPKDLRPHVLTYSIYPNKISASDVTQKRTSIFILCSSNKKISEFREHFQKQIKIFFREPLGLQNLHPSFF
jgi:hypothetical protein